MHIPNVCTYSEGFTEYYIESYDADFNNADILHLCRPDGTSVRRDYRGEDTDEDGYRQPTFDDDPDPGAV